MESQNAEQYLVEEIRQGNQSAWRQLIDRYHGRLLAFARARTAALADAEDLVQDTFIGFLQSLNHFSTDRSLETYLFTILRYKLIDRLRGRKITPLREPEDDEDWWDRILPASGESPSHAAAHAEAGAAQEEILTTVLRRLIHDYRDRQAFRDLQVIELVLFAGKRNLDVAELFDMDQKAVAGIKFRAINKLRSYLEDCGEATHEALAEEHAEVTVAKVWRSQRLTCLKRSTLGAYLIGVLEEPWLSYTQFHLDVVACPMCLANLTDIEEQDLGEPEHKVPEHIFTSSVGFLSKASATDNK